jgi:hypothetical protein
MNTRSAYPELEVPQTSRPGFVPNRANEPDAANYHHEREGMTMTTASCAPVDAPAPEIPDEVLGSGLNPADYLHQDVSKMNMTCRWVRADDGALVMDWTAAEGAAVHPGTGGTEAADAFEVLYHGADALTPAGV